MQNHIDQLLRLSEKLNFVSNQNAIAAQEACRTISQSNGTLRKALCPLLMIESKK